VLALTTAVMLAGAGVPGCGGPTAAPARSNPTTRPSVHGPVDVLYAASLEHLFESTLGPAFDKSSGDSFTGFAGGSEELASDIKGKVRQADVFLSANPKVNARLEGTANGDWVSWYSTLASAPLVLGYNPHSRFAARIKSQPWYDVISLPGFRVGRTDPHLDPKGQLTVEALREIEAKEHVNLAPVISSTTDVFPEETLVGELQSGQIDAGFFYSNEAKAAGIPTVSLAPVALQASYTVTVVNRAPHAAEAAAFVAWLYSPAGQRILARSGLNLPGHPQVAGDTAAVPRALRSVLGVSG
jgi:molybdate/tungstate transport system substrate-binding protein